MNDQDRAQESRLQEIRRRARELKERERAHHESRTRFSGRGPSVTAWRPAGASHGATGYPVGMGYPGYSGPLAGSMAYPGDDRRRGADWSPRASVFERDDALIARFELPGLERKDVDVRVEGQSLVVEGERPDDRPDRDAAQSAWGYGPFRKEIELPYPVDSGDVKARFRNGMLEVTVPQPSREDRRRRIKIET